MPVHDWSRALAGDFHAFHRAWSIRIQDALNEGVLGPDYYALVEQRDPRREADILTLQLAAPDGGADGPSWGGGSDSAGSVALAEAPPRVRTVQRTSEAAEYARRANVVTVRHASGDRPVATIEIVSPGNKDRPATVADFCRKVDECVSAGRHFLLVDVLPPTPPAPEGLHAAYWALHGGTPPEPLPADEPLCLASYRSVPVGADFRPEAYLTLGAVGSPLPEMPVFLTAERSIHVPLEQTYADTWDAVPAPVKRRVEETA